MSKWGVESNIHCYFRYCYGNIGNDVRAGWIFRVSFGASVYLLSKLLLLYRSFKQAYAFLSVYFDVILIFLATHSRLQSDLFLRIAISVIVYYWDGYIGHTCLPEKQKIASINVKYQPTNVVSRMIENNTWITLFIGVIFRPNQQFVVWLTKPFDFCWLVR